MSRLWQSQMRTVGTNSWTTDGGTYTRLSAHGYTEGQVTPCWLNSGALRERAWPVTLPRAPCSRQAGQRRLSGILPRSRHLPVAVTDGSSTTNLNRIGV